MSHRRPDWLKTLSGTARIDRSEPAEGVAAITRLAEKRLDVAEPCPATISDSRAAKLWDELVERLMARRALTAGSLRLLERLCLMNQLMWAGKLTAATAREIAALERQLGLAEAAPLVPPAPRGSSKFADLKYRAMLADEEWARDPAAARERCRGEAAEAVALASRLRFDRKERRRLLEIKDKKP